MVVSSVDGFDYSVKSLSYPNPRLMSFSILYILLVTEKEQCASLLAYLRLERYVDRT